MAKRRTATGLGIHDLLDSRIKADGSYAENVAAAAALRRSEDTLKYGGGGKGKRRLHGFLSGLVSKKYADEYSQRNADPEEMEKAFQEGKLLRGEKPSAPNATGIPNAVDGGDDLSLKIDSILGLVTQIATRISSKDAVGVNKSGYNALAPAGGFPRVVTKSKFFGRDITTAPSATKMTAATAVMTAAQLKTQMKEKKDVKDSEPDDTPKTYAETVARKKAEQKATETLKYGGEGKFQKMRHGFLSGFASSAYADKVAAKHADPSVMEKAFRVLNPLSKKKSGGGADGNDTATQLSAASAHTSGVHSEKIEAEDEDRQVIIDKLDEIITMIGGGVSGGQAQGSGGGVVSALSNAYMASRLAPMAMGALRMAAPVAGVVGAGYLGYKAGGAAYDFASEHGLTRPAESIIDRVTGIDDPDKSYREGMAASVAKKNEALRGTGYTATEAGYKGPDGKILFGKDLPPELQKKLGLNIPTPASAKPTPTPNKEAAVAATVAENAELKSEVKEAKSIVNNITQVAASSQAPQGESSKEVLKVVVRNVEPSVATYTASIFDHPVVHPGIYGM